MNEGTSRTRGRYVGVATEGGAAPSTRDRILEIALDLFIEKGFDKSSLREIAEQLGFSKAAIYYHFASKDDILMALHMRLHDIGRQAIEGLEPAAGGSGLVGGAARRARRRDAGQPQDLRHARSEPLGFRAAPPPGARGRA